MTEQIVEGMIRAKVDTERRRIVPKDELDAETVAVPSKPVNVIWQVQSGQVRLIGEQSKSVTERLNEAYRDDELEPQEREFLDLSREHFSRLDER